MSFKSYKLHLLLRITKLKTAELTAAATVQDRQQGAGASSERWPEQSPTDQTCVNESFHAVVCVCVCWVSHQRLQLFAVYQVEFSGKVVKVLVAGVDVSFSSHQQDPIEMMDVNVHKHAEETTQDLLTDLDEVLREGNSWKTTRAKRKNKQHETSQDVTHISVCKTGNHLNTYRKCPSLQQLNKLNKNQKPFWGSEWVRRGNAGINLAFGAVILLWKNVCVFV